ncbi:MAG: hypothetical protein ACTH3G_08595 [Citricoccus sp.]
MAGTVPLLPLGDAVAVLGERRQEAEGGHERARSASLSGAA